MKRELNIILLILTISLFFRLYNFQNLQFWSEDEELAASFVRRMIVDSQITLVSHNYAINAPLGSFFHLLSVPIFYLSQMDPTKVLIITSFLGTATTFLMYKLGKLIKDDLLGVSASLMYASSFVISLADRRWWPLSLNTFLATLTLYSILKIKKKRYKYLAPLAACIGFSWHADPTLAILAFSAALYFLIFKVNIFKKELLYAAIVIAIFILPLIVFEIRHPGAFTNQLERTLTTKGEGFNLTQNITIPSNPILIFSHIFFPYPSKIGEEFLCYCPTDKNTFFPLATVPITSLLIVYPVFQIIKKKDTASLGAVYMPVITLIALAIVYIIVFKNAIYPHYYTIIYPSLIMLAAYTLNSIQRYKLIFLSGTIIFMAVNLFALLNTSMKYSLYQKAALINSVSTAVDESNFSLYSSRADFIHNGGFTTLFNLIEKPPKTSYIYKYHDYLFTVYELYPRLPSNRDSEKTVLIKDVNDNSLDSLGKMAQQSIISGNLEALIFNTNDQNLDLSILDKKN